MFALTVYTPGYILPHMRRQSEGSAYEAFEHLNEPEVDDEAIERELDRRLEEEHMKEVEKRPQPVDID